MRYYTYVDEAKRNKKGVIPVQILFKENNKRFTVATELTVTTKFTGVAIPPTEKYARMKTARLLKIFDDVEKCVMTMPDDADWENKKAILRKVVTGKDEKKEKRLTVADYVAKYAETKTNEGTRALYLLTERKIRSYDEKATFESVNTAWLDGWVVDNAGMSVNGFSIHLRNLRTVFNWAIDNEWTDKYPFRRYKIRNERVAIRNISVGELRAIRDWPVEGWQEIYRDLFILTFYLCGINPVDLLHLKKTDMKNGRIRYKRRKTGHLFDIPVPKPAEDIISRYRGRKWLLSPMDEHSNYKDFCSHWNHALKKIGTIETVADRVGRKRKLVYAPVVEGLTVYTARYTFASIGAELDIPRETIALCLGHSWADVTSHYIAYDSKKIDAAVQKIVDYVGME